APSTMTMVLYSGTWIEPPPARMMLSRNFRSLSTRGRSRPTRSLKPRGSESMRDRRGGRFFPGGAGGGPPPGGGRRPPRGIGAIELHSTGVGLTSETAGALDQIAQPLGLARERVPPRVLDLAG